MADSDIEWTGKTDNPTTGCDHESPGCDFCYAMILAARLKAMGSPAYQNDGDPRTSGPGFALTMHWDRLDRMQNQARSARKPVMHFVNSMSDLFHAKVTKEFLAHTFAVFAQGAATGQTYQVLTKRPKRMRDILAAPEWWQDWFIPACEARGVDYTDVIHWVPGRGAFLPNVHLGTSVESQKYANIRIPFLLETPAAVPFLSMEPLLERVKLYPSWLGGVYGCGACLGEGETRKGMCPQCHGSGRVETGVQWVIVGGESGPGARPFDPDWAREIRDDCGTAGVPVFVKQMGSVWAAQNGFKGKGNHPEEWPEPFPREFPVSRETAAL